MSIDSVRDELVSINSIFGHDTLLPIDEEARIYSLHLPTVPSMTLRIQFPQNYPDTTLSIIGTQSVGQHIPKGAGHQVVDSVRDVLSAVYHPGQPCVYDLLEEIRGMLENVQEHGDFSSQDETKRKIPGKMNNKTTLPDPVLNPDAAPLWIVGRLATEKRSKFLARVASVSSQDQVKRYRAHLLASDKKIARATHNMVAWRIKCPDRMSFQDFDDDGETAAGSRILHLMENMDVWNVMVVVTRWYGGILLGTDRFRIINTVVREALLLGGFTKQKKTDDTGQKRPG